MYITYKMQLTNLACFLWQPSKIGQMENRHTQKLLNSHTVCLFFRFLLIFVQLQSFEPLISMLPNFVISLCLSICIYNGKLHDEVWYICYKKHYIPGSFLILKQAVFLPQNFPAHDTVDVGHETIREMCCSVSHAWLHNDLVQDNKTTIRIIYNYMPLYRYLYFAATVNSNNDNVIQ